MKKQFSRWSDEYSLTTNRSVYNKIRKWMLEQKCEIHCSYCGYHSNENETNKYYGETRSWLEKGEKEFRFPNWKLVSKKEKQWMSGTYRKVIRYSNYYPDSIDFKV